MLTLDEIKKLMEDFKSIGLGEIEISQGDFRLKLTSENYVNKSFDMQKSIIDNSLQNQWYAGNNVQTPTIPQDEKITEIEKPQEPEGRYVTAPVVGTIYTAPSPTDAPFIKVGDKVTKGQVIFVIESMKLLNEVVSDIEGEVAEILVENAQAVEYGQQILRII